MSEPLSKYMLIFTIGPVQTFISQARKTRDLWAGSLMLSKLMEAAMADIKEKEGGKFVFPSVQTVDNIPDIPNKYIAVFEAKSPEAVEEIAKASRKRIETYWKKIQEQVFEKVILTKLLDDTLRAIWTRQTHFEHVFEVYYAILPYSASSKKYGEGLEKLEAQLAARKRLRDFLPQEEPGEKSSMSGERQVLSNSKLDARAFWRMIAAERSDSTINKQGEERLDAIDTIKRFATVVKDPQTTSGSHHPYQNPFPSTSSIAVASFVEGLLKNEISTTVLNEWKNTTQKLAETIIGSRYDIPYLGVRARQKGIEWLLERDGDLYFPEVFEPKSLERTYNIIGRESVEIRNNARPALRALLEATDAAQITRPTPYYATIQMDGDHMGMLLSGVKSEKDHTEISTQLSRFSRIDAKHIVEGHYPGRLVYAGGDDVLAFAPLARDYPDSDEPEHILNLVNVLQQQYIRQVKAALPEDAKAERVDNVTASIGIAIAHHYTSLSYVLRAAREAESKAKKQYERNALVVTLIRRSGEQTRVGCHWNYKGLDDDGQPIPLFSRFYTMFKKDVLSPKCIYILLEEAPALVGLEPIAQISEIKRVLLRQLDERKINTFSDFKPEDKKENYIQEQAKHLTRLAAAMDGERLNEVLQPVPERSAAETEKLARLKAASLSFELHADEKRRYGLVETLGWLLVMAFLARKEQE